MPLFLPLHFAQNAQFLFGEGAHTDMHMQVGASVMWIVLPISFGVSNVRI